MSMKKDYLKIATIYSRKYWQYYSTAKRITNNKMLADDIVQSAFQYILEHYEEKKNWEIENLERYIMAIVRNHARRMRGEDAKERHRTTYLLMDNDSMGGLDEPFFLHIEKQCDMDNVRKALRMLHPRHSEYLVLYYVKHRSDREIADLMRVKRKSIPVLRYRAKKELRHILIKLDGNPDRP